MASAVVAYTLQSCIRNGDGDRQSIQSVAARSDGNSGKHGKKHKKAKRDVRVDLG
jgi:hypothetical protein